MSFTRAKQYILLLFPMFCLLIAKEASGQSTPFEDQFAVAVKTVSTAFSKGDSATLSRYIHKPTGVYYVVRIGVYDVVEKDSTLEHQCFGPPQYEAYKGLKTFALQYDALPDYNCGTEDWNRHGTFCDTTAHDSLLSRSATWCNQYGASVQYSSQQIQAYQALESISRRVVVANTSNKPSLVFYLSYIEGKWWLTIIDCVETDCSA